MATFQGPMSTHLQEIGTEAERVVCGLRWKRPFLVVPGDARNDFGVDATIELCDMDQNGNKTLTGKQVHVQIKGTEHPERSVEVKTSTWHYWDALAVPTLLLLVNLENSQIMWSLPWQKFPKRPSSTMKFNFSPSRTVGDAGQDFTDLLVELSEIELGSRVLLSLPEIRESVAPLWDVPDAVPPKSPFGMLYDHIRAVLMMGSYKVLPSLRNLWAERVEPLACFDVDELEFPWTVRAKILKELAREYVLNLHKIRQLNVGAAWRTGDRLHPMLEALDEGANILDLARLRHRLECYDRVLTCAHSPCLRQPGSALDSLLSLDELDNDKEEVGSIAACCAVGDDWGQYHRASVDEAEIQTYIFAEQNLEPRHLVPDDPSFQIPWFNLT